MAACTRHVPLLSRFQLDERGVRVGVAQDLNTMREIEEGRHEKEKPRRVAGGIKCREMKGERWKRREVKCYLYLPDQFHLG